MGTLAAGIAAMGAAAVTWLAIGAVLTGVGLAVQRRAAATPLSSDCLLSAFWLGVCIAIAALQLWNILLPVGWPAPLLIATLGAVGLVSHRTELIPWVRRRPSIPTAALSLALILWLANLALDAGTVVDYGIYHATAVHWMTDHRLVPGLANLHPHLGLQSAYWLYAAALEASPWRGRADHIATLSLALPLMLQAILGARRFIATGEPAARSAALFDFVLIIPLVGAAISNHAVSFTPDLPAAFLVFAGASRAYRFLADPPQPGAAARSEVALILSLLVCAACFKLSALAFGGLASTVVLAAWVTGPARPRPLLPGLAAAAALPSILFFGFAARGVVISGYPLYPLSAVAAPVPWRTPPATVDAVHAWVVQYARLESMTPASLAEGVDWLGAWVLTIFIADTHFILFPVLSACLCWLAIILALRGRARRLVDRPLLLVGATLVALALWIATAPARRFGFFLTWTLAATSAAILCRVRLESAPADLRRAIAFGVGAFAAALPLTNPATARKLIADGPSMLAQMFFRTPGPDAGFHPRPRALVAPFRTDSGLVVHVPVSPPEPLEPGLLFGAPLPATPFPQPTLRLRLEGDLESGFLLAPGATLPDDFPVQGSTFMRLWREREP